MFWRWRWRCIFEHPVEEHVLCSRTHCNLAPPMGGNPGQRAANVYSVGGTTYSAPKYYTSVGDALNGRTDYSHTDRYIAPPSATENDQP
jgi:hypothetical protein